MALLIGILLTSSRRPPLIRLVHLGIQRVAVPAWHPVICTHPSHISEFFKLRPCVECLPLVWNVMDSESKKGSDDNSTLQCGVCSSSLQLSFTVAATAVEG